MENTITFKKNEFQTFLDTLEFISNSNECMSIFDGRMLQVSNGNKALFDVDFSSLIGSNDIMLSQILYRFKILNLSENEDEIKLTIEENQNATRYIFEDSTSKIIFYKAHEKMVKNSNNYDRELINNKTLDLDEDAKIGSITIDEKSIKKIRSYAKLSESAMIKLEFEGNNVKFLLSPSDSNVGTEIVALIGSIDEKLNGTVQYPIDAFYAKTGEISLDLFYNKTRDNIWGILNFSIGDEPKIDCSIHCFSVIEKDDEDEEEEETDMEFEEMLNDF
ncbi:MAG: hypothetical protein ACOCP4_02900 [Candidatus Woesearchaeota archaeon]